MGCARAGICPSMGALPDEGQDAGWHPFSVFLPDGGACAPLGYRDGRKAVGGKVTEVVFFDFYNNGLEGNSVLIFVTVPTGDDGNLSERPIF